MSEVVFIARLTDAQRTAVLCALKSYIMACRLEASINNKPARINHSYEEEANCAEQAFNVLAGNVR